MKCFVLFLWKLVRLKVPCCNCQRTANGRIDKVPADQAELTGLRKAHGIPEKMSALIFRSESVRGDE